MEVVVFTLSIPYYKLVFILTNDLIIIIAMFN